MPDVGNAKCPTAEGAESPIMRERRLLAEAHAEFTQGQFLTGDAVEAWLDALDGEAALPPPRANGRRAGS